MIINTSNNWILHLPSGDKYNSDPQNVGRAGLEHAATFYSRRFLGRLARCECP